MAATIKEIARLAKTSTATVSRAIHGKKGLSVETAGRINKICELLDYHPNLWARNLVTNSTDIVEIIIPQTEQFAFSNPYYSEIMKGIGERASGLRGSFILSFVGERSYTLNYKQGLSAGIIVLANRIDDQRIEEARKIGIPLVLIPGIPDCLDIASVDFDNVCGAYMAVDYLVGLGHRRIAFLNGPMNSKYSIERLIGYKKALEKNNLPFKEELVINIDYSIEGGYKTMKDVLSIPVIPTAVLMINDYSAMGALLATKKVGYRVPEDISIVGFGDVPFASMTDPPLTTIREPFRDLGYEAFGILYKLVRKKKISNRQIVLPVELIVRESTAPLSSKREKIS